MDSNKVDRQKLYLEQTGKHSFGRITFWLSSNLTLGWHVVWVNKLQNTASCTTKTHWEGHCFYLDIHHLCVCLAGFVCSICALTASREFAVTGMETEGSPSSDMNISYCVIQGCVFLKHLWSQSKPQDQSNRMLSSMFGLNCFYSRSYML